MCAPTLSARSWLTIALLALDGCLSFAPPPSLLATVARAPHSPAAAAARMEVQAPPTIPPTCVGGDGDDDGERFALETISRDERSAIASLWLWQTELQLESGACDASEVDDVERLRHMQQWAGEEDTGGMLSQLKGRAFAARMGSETLGIVLLRYELDKSSLVAAVAGQHIMVVEALVLTPSLPRALEPAARSGIRSLVFDMAQFHNMRLQFDPGAFGSEL